MEGNFSMKKVLSFFMVLALLAFAIAMNYQGNKNAIWLAMLTIPVVIYYALAVIELLLSKRK